MLSAAAVFLSALALGIVATTGETLIGWAAVLTALAAVIGALGTSIANLRKTSRLESAVGPPNGKSLLTLVHEVKNLVTEIKSFEDYQHSRNHKVLGELTEIKLAVPLILTLAERLLDRLNQEN